MMTHMKERLAGKIGNANNNAFMLRKLFKMYDTAGSGFVSTLSFFSLQEPCCVLMLVTVLSGTVVNGRLSVCKSLLRCLCESLVVCCRFHVSCWYLLMCTQLKICLDS